jgi:hypothetical protein
MQDALANDDSSAAWCEYAVGVFRRTNVERSLRIPGCFFGLHIIFFAQPERNQSLPESVVSRTRGLRISIRVAQLSRPAATPASSQPPLPASAGPDASDSRAAHTPRPTWIPPHAAKPIGEPRPVTERDQPPLWRGMLDRLARLADAVRKEDQRERLVQFWGRVFERQQYLLGRVSEKLASGEAVEHTVAVFARAVHLIGRVLFGGPSSPPPPPS